MLDFFQENRANKSEINKRTRKLTVTNVDTTNDLGEYKCVAYCAEPQSATYNITTISHGSFFNITKIDQFSHLESSTNKSAEMVLVKYQGYPPPDFQWFDKNNKLINWTSKEDINRKLEAFVNLNRTWTALKIRNATISDSGNYTLTVLRGNSAEHRTVEMLIAGIQ